MAINDCEAVTDKDLELKMGDLLEVSAEGIAKGHQFVLAKSSRGKGYVASDYIAERGSFLAEP